VRLLDLVKPFLPILPEIEAPYQKVRWNKISEGFEAKSLTKFL
jgi:hypothetical protein